MNRRRRAATWAGAALLGLAGVAGWKFHGQVRASLVRAGLLKGRTVAEVVEDLGGAALGRFEPACRDGGIAWPPARVRLLAFKEERRIEVWLAAENGAFRKAATYPVLGASGGAGPKRRSGDRQVPEGFYRLSALNPNSRFHLSLRVDYPNAEDVAHRTVERNEMGGDIYVHGGTGSIGCLAVGDPAIEEIFCLVAQVPPEEREIWIAPRDFRAQPMPAAGDAWVTGLYGRLARRLNEEHPEVPARGF